MLSGFEKVVVTSSNQEQCELFRIELERRKGRFFSESCTVLAISDPLGVRVGSGGATFHAIAEAYDGRNLLVLHSGGDSRRNPLCSVTGKAFAAANFDPV
jgi:fucokinase